MTDDPKSNPTPTNSSAGEPSSPSRLSASERGVVAGGDISGTVLTGDIAGDVTIGYTAAQVNALLAQITTTFTPKPFDGRCPYLGLDAFDEQDADRFFGREKLVAQLVSRVKDSRFLVIAGPSGSGKSSLVRAGLVHALKQGALPNSDRWLYESLKPGRDPLEELARVASSLAESLNAGDDIRTRGLTDASILHRWVDIALKDDRTRRAVIFVDQFEEVFTQVAQENQRAAFLNLLTYAATVEAGRVTVLFALRSDFVSNCATYPQLNTLVNQQFIQIGAMEPDELVSAIARPALQVGLKIDPELIAQIMNDMQGEPGALPLMQFALKDLFDAEQARGGPIALRLDDYLARGGLRKALERHADAEFATLSAPEQQLARAIFSGLIEVGRGTEDTRRTALFQELVPAHGDEASVENVVRKLADARLVTVDVRAQVTQVRTVTLAHERLIDAWPWLRKLVNENRESIALQNQIAEAAREWDQHGR
ncbi:MAG TPA: ATP-binding protein, partial [Anaerolineae bacterium]